MSEMESEQKRYNLEVKILEEMLELENEMS